MSERYSLIGASRESVRDLVHRTSVLFNPSRKFRRIVAVDETVVGLKLPQNNTKAVRSTLLLLGLLDGLKPCVPNP